MSETVHKVTEKLNELDYKAEKQIADKTHWADETLKPLRNSIDKTVTESSIKINESTKHTLRADEPPPPTWLLPETWDNPPRTDPEILKRPPGEEVDE